MDNLRGWRSLGLKAELEMEADEFFLEKQREDLPGDLPSLFANNEGFKVPS
ncbi:MAG: hypothetical protein MUP98_06615 [Candidatus Aminicenantes bacterium]|nr:hypothetical protein [Candidatus Aminicenantes bacterium]